MRYLDSYRALFNSPNWAMNLLFLTVCTLIPVVGALVMMGYLVEVIIYKHRHGDEGSYPDFNFDRFVPYLKRGLWPFVVYVLVGIVISVVAAFLMIALFCCIGSIKPGGVLVTLAVFALVGITFVVSTLAMIVSAPLTLRTGLEADLAPAFRREYLREFFRLVGKETVVTMLFFVASQTVLISLGALCCVGFYVATAVSYFAMFHLEYQLYELYLSRSGQPIEIQDPEELTPPGTSAAPPPADGPAPPPLH